MMDRCVGRLDSVERGALADRPKLSKVPEPHQIGLVVQEPALQEPGRSIRFLIIGAAFSLRFPSGPAWQPTHLPGATRFGAYPPETPSWIAGGSDTKRPGGPGHSAGPSRVPVS